MPARVAGFVFGQRDFEFVRDFGDFAAGRDGVQVADLRADVVRAIRRFAGALEFPDFGAGDGDFDHVGSVG